MEVWQRSSLVVAVAKRKRCPSRLIALSFLYARVRRSCQGTKQTCENVRGSVFLIRGKNTLHRECVRNTDSPRERDDFVTMVWEPPSWPADSLDSQTKRHEMRFRTPVSNLIGKRTRIRLSKFACPNVSALTSLRDPLSLPLSFPK
jgi:hypothetical protein